MTRTYSELIERTSFEDRFRYLMTRSPLGEETFGFERYLNQVFYNSPEWRIARRKAILRDNGCDLGIESHPIFGKLFVHHLNPITIDDIRNRSRWILDPEYLITVSFETHNALHYSNEEYINNEILIERKPGDTIPWIGDQHG